MYLRMYVCLYVRKYRLFYTCNFDFDSFTVYRTMVFVRGEICILPNRLRRRRDERKSSIKY